MTNLSFIKCNNLVYKVSLNQRKSAYKNQYIFKIRLYKRKIDQYSVMLFI